MGKLQWFFDELTFSFAYICPMDVQLLAMTLWEKLDAWDKWLFMKLNSGHTNSFFDFILPYFRDSVFWAPLYIFILVFITVNFGKNGWLWSLGLICTVATVDIIGARVFKEGFERLRPCQDPMFFQNVRLLLKHCSGSYSFVSNHAANHFAIATYISLTTRPSIGKWVYALYIWAALIAYAQIYVGVHFPLDTLAGAGLGTLMGIVYSKAFYRQVGNFTLA
jgi:undecaprenyl-diphosphatase